MNESAFHPEDKARSLIDRRLVACEWLIQSKADMNVGAGFRQRGCPRCWTN
jgi:type I restriction enzyme R subunit